MNHVIHLDKNKENLKIRFEVLKLIREWFWLQGFTEIEAPIIVKSPGQEPNLSPMKINIHNENGNEFDGYLHTSPEYTMKKMLSAGWDKIYYLGKCFRDVESFGGTHNPEFTMLEWYRVESDIWGLMEDIGALTNFILSKLKILDFRLQISEYDFTKISMKDLWLDCVGVNLDDYLTSEKMLGLCREKGYGAEDGESYEELFYRVFLNEVEPKLATMGAVIIYHYPAQMASLSRLSESDPRYAERFEAYIDGLELANAFSELTDSKEQKRRLQEEHQERARNGKEVFALDNEFIEALDHMPKSAGIALGVDRLVMALTGCKNINDVITLPSSKIFLD